MKKNFGKNIIVYFDIYAFTHYLKLHDNNKVMTILLEIWDFINEICSKSKAETYLFSDCGFLIYPTINTDQEQVLRTCVEDVEQLLDKFLDFDLFIRGSIVYGNVIRATNLVIGEAVVESVRLESKCPGPFIILPLSELKKIRDEKVNPFIEELGKTYYIKNGENIIQCKIIFPLSRDVYESKLSEKYESSTLTPNGSHAHFWGEGLHYLKKS